MIVMPGLMPGIHVFLILLQQDVDGRAKASGSDAVLRTTMPGHDERKWSNMRKRHVNPQLPALTPAHAATM
jgi:hypothetical protein